MKKNTIKTVSIVIFVIALIMLIVGIVLSNINDKEETMIDNTKIIKENYTRLSTSAVENTQIRKSLSDKIATFNNKTYAEEHNDYVEILTKYNANIKELDEIVANTDDKCNEQYDDKTISMICRSLDILYEETINIYVTNLTQYNNKITSYNETSETDFAVFEMLHKEYIDFNQDEEYKGKSTEISQ